VCSGIVIVLNYTQLFFKFVVLDEYLLCLNIFLDITGTAGIAPSRG